MKLFPISSVILCIYFFGSARANMYTSCGQGTRLGDAALPDAPLRDAFDYPMAYDERAFFNPACSACKLAMREVDNRIGTDRNRFRVENAVHDACNHLPHSISGHCNNFINNHGNQIVDFILRTGVPRAVCTAFRLC
ncbi:saposin-C-like [Calliopsis andreniformis]|uniref:saposin-C-like n=1 Tax=Calliopsis andreniformis TaxID=337506 RepID=UPI003FCCE474